MTTRLWKTHKSRVQKISESFNRSTKIQPSTYCKSMIFSIFILQIHVYNLHTRIVFIHILNFTFQQQLAQYDFQFNSWPVDFHWNESEDSLDRKKFEKIYDRSEASSSFIGRVFSLPGRIARYRSIEYDCSVTHSGTQ